MTYWGLGIAFLFLGVVGLLLQLRPERVMKKTGGPGIVAFELARSTDRARAILLSWGEKGRAAARSSLYADFLLIIGYSGLLSVVLAASAHQVGLKTWGWMTGLSNAIVLAALLAGLCDVIENVLLLLVLQRGETPTPVVQPFAIGASVAARIKFCILIGLIAWILLVEFPIVVTPAGRAI